MRQIRQTHFWPIRARQCWADLVALRIVWEWGEEWAYDHEGD